MQFDLSFKPDVVKVSDVEDGKIGGEDVPIFMWRLNPDKDAMMRVIAHMPIGKGVSGSGYVAEIKFEVKGEEGEKSELSLMGYLVNTSDNEIFANWYGAEVTIGVEEEEEEEEEEVEVTPGSSNITAWEPAETVVGNVVGESRAFNITVDQTADISWQINGTEVQTNESTREAVFTNTSAVVGTWNISAIATNTTTGLSDMHTWIWSVTTTAITPTPTLAPGVTPTPEAEIEVTPTPKPTATPTTKRKPTPTPKSTPKPAVPGFEAIFAIAGMVGIAYMQLRRKHFSKKG